MKNGKKLLALGLAICLAAGVTACGGNSTANNDNAGAGNAGGQTEAQTPAGDQAENEAPAGGQTEAGGSDAANANTTDADFTMLSPEWDLVDMAFYADGTCVFHLDQYGIIEDCTWEYADGVLTVTKSDGTTAVSEMDGDTMKLEYDSVTAPGQMVGKFESTDWADFFQ